MKKINKSNYNILVDVLSDKLSNMLQINPRTYLDTALVDKAYIKLEREMYGRLYIQLDRQLGSQLRFQIIGQIGQLNEKNK